MIASHAAQLEGRQRSVLALERQRGDLADDARAKDGRLDVEFAMRVFFCDEGFIFHIVPIVIAGFISFSDSVGRVPPGRYVLACSLG